MKLYTLLVCFACSVLVPAFADNSRQSKQVSGLSPSELRLVSFQLKLSDDPNNPYTSKYSIIDKWMYENFQQSSSSNSAAILDSSGGKRILQGTVDAHGYKVPYRDYLISVEDLRKQGSFEFKTQDNALFYAQGEMSEELYNLVLQTNYEVLANYLPAIPDWLLGDDIQEIAFVPNGDFLVIKPIVPADAPERSSTSEEQPNVNNNKEKGCGGGRKERIYYRYNHSGELLAADKAWLNTFDGLTVEQYPAPLMNVREDGIVSFKEADGTLKAVYDYDWHYLGTSLPPMRDLHYFLFYPKDTISNVYKAQHHS
jgi:hypothetical protein